MSHSKKKFMYWQRKHKYLMVGSSYQHVDGEIAFLESKFWNKLEGYLENGWTIDKIVNMADKDIGDRMVYILKKSRIVDDGLNRTR